MTFLLANNAFACFTRNNSILKIKKAADISLSTAF